MRLKALLAISALVFAAACTQNPTGPSTSRVPTVQRSDSGPGTYGSNGVTGGGTNTVGSGG